MKRTIKDVNKHALQLKKRHEQYHKRKQKHILRNVDLNRQQDDLQNQIIDDFHLSESDQKPLQNFHSKINALTNTLYTIYNEQFLSIKLK